MESFVPLLVSGVAQGQTPKQEPLFLEAGTPKLIGWFRAFQASPLQSSFSDTDLTDVTPGALAEKAEHIQQDDDDDRYAREPQDEIAKHGLHFLQVIQVRGRGW
jgi:hypothetical protein